MAKKVKKPVSEMTEDEKKVREAIMKKRKAKKAEKLDKITACIQFAADNADEALSKIAKALLSKARAPQENTRKGGTVKSLFETYFPEVGAVVHEDRLWKEVQLGRLEMRKQIKNAIAKLAPEDRFWVKFDLDSKSYQLLGRGANPPEGWTGYSPIVLDGEEIA